MKRKITAIVLAASCLFTLSCNRLTVTASSADAIKTKTQDKISSESREKLMSANSNDSLKKDRMSVFGSQLAQSIDKADADVMKGYIEPGSQAETWLSEKIEEAGKRPFIFKGFSFENAEFKKTADRKPIGVLTFREGKNKVIHAMITFSPGEGNPTAQEIIFSDDIEVYGASGNRVKPMYLKTEKEESDGIMYFDTEEGQTVYFPFTDKTYMMPGYLGKNFRIYKSRSGFGLTSTAFQEYMFRTNSYVFTNGGVDLYLRGFKPESALPGGRFFDIGDSVAEIYQRTDTPWTGDPIAQLGEAGIGEEEAKEIYREVQLASYAIKNSEQYLAEGKVPNTTGNEEPEVPGPSGNSETPSEETTESPRGDNSDKNIKKVVTEAISYNDNAYADFTKRGEYISSLVKIEDGSPMEKKWKEEIASHIKNGNKYTFTGDKDVKIVLNGDDSGTAFYTSTFINSATGKTVENICRGEFKIVNGKVLFYSETE